MPTLSHIGIAAPPAKFAAAVAFYARALAPLDYTTLLALPGRVGMGSVHTKAPDFWISSKEDAAERQQVHVAFNAKDQATVRAFHAAALSPSSSSEEEKASVGTDNGAPGIRAQYRATYYAAFVLDPLGNNIEAVHDPAGVH